MVRVVLFVPVVLVLGSNSWCNSSIEQNDLFFTQRFGLAQPYGAGSPPQALSVLFLCPNCILC